MKLNYVTKKKEFSESQGSLVIVATEDFYKKQKKILESCIPSEIVSFMCDREESLAAGDSGKTIKSFLPHERFKSAAFIVLPQKVSRGNSPTRKFFIDKHLASSISGKKVSLLFAVDESAHVDAMVNSLAKTNRTLTYKTKDGKIQKTKTDSTEVSILMVNSQTGSVVSVSDKSKALFSSVNWCMSLVDRAPSELNPEAYSKEIQKRFAKNNAVKMIEIKGRELVKAKLGGIWSVGKAAVNAPRLVALHYKPKSAKKRIAIVGKGVTYDTGGLHLKISGSMSGMKTDMGGSAAVLAAFEHLVNSGSKNELIAVVGLVENAIGPEAYKPDDIVYMHSGKTVEINNTDAEGRLVLGDCVSWVARKFEPSMLIDAATLTGAQLVATGMNHAAVVCNDEKLELKAVAVGKTTGDLVCPLVFAPDILRNEFSSSIADMKNSVKNRMNAQTSCAANFIYAHIEDLRKLKWLHIDLAGPASSGDNLGTGYGVNLISRLCQ